MRIFVATFCNSVESLSINETHVDDDIPAVAPIGHCLYCLACLVPVAVSVVVETISHRIADRLVPNHDVWHARLIRQHTATCWHRFI